MIKYASNAFLAVKISYINEIAKFCEVIGANALEVAKGMGLDIRIGPKLLQLSSGWSGSCFPKDTAELLATSQKYGSELQLVKSAIMANEGMQNYCVEKASYIISRLLELGADNIVHDPKGMEKFKSLNSTLEVRYANEAEEVATRVDAVTF